MNLRSIIQSIRASRDISWAIQEGRKPDRRDLAVLGLEDIFDRDRNTRKPLS